MAGPVRTSEIEDFVSSVRRLVSVDARSRPVTRDLRPDRLVLTPAQRVRPEAAPALDPLILTTRAKDEDLEDRVAQDAEPAFTAEALFTDEATQPVEAVWEEELWAEPEAPLAELALVVEEAELVAEATVDDPVPAAEGPRPDPALAEPQDAEGGSPWSEVGDDWLDEDLELLRPGETVPMPDTPIKAAAAEAEPRRPEALRLSGEDMLTDADGNPLTVLDEAALQQMIRQLIRDELKGVLGERITQSVRKLVRAEINRALAAHALD